MATLREALEAALVENPEDIAAHMAYADHLNESGDPRGELIQTQLALENEALPSNERKQLKVREAQLLKETRTDCLGQRLAALLDRGGYGGGTTRIARGWLARIATVGLEADLTEALVTAPQARLLRELVVAYLPVETHRVPDEPDTMALLTDSTNLTNLRILRLGTDEGFAPVQNEPRVYNSREELYDAGDRLWDWIATLLHLEELSLECRTHPSGRLFGLSSLTNLRVLQVNLSDDYPMGVLAGNPALANLTHLSLHPMAAAREYASMSEPYLHAHDLAALANSPRLRSLTHLRFQKSDAGDAGVRALIDSGRLSRLKFLDLAMGTITDVGADLLADADTGNLEVLDLTENALTAAGQQRLTRALGQRLTLRTDRQNTDPNPEWIYWGEME
jgi:uncharacterized protein (TIGR02996 family)